MSNILQAGELALKTQKMPCSLPAIGWGSAAPDN